MTLRRRDFLAAGLSAAALAGLSRRSPADELPPVRAITRGPKYHWFGYYDKFEFDPTNRYVLSNEVDFEHRSPQPGDVINVGMVDLADADKWIELGQTNAWCWQQGCMLQWRPGAQSEVAWNDREGDKFVCRLLDIKTQQFRTLPAPIYTFSPDGSFALVPDFARLNVMRPGYGYAGLPDEHGDQLAPPGTGVFHVDMRTGEKQLILSLADVAKIPWQGKLLDDVWHWFRRPAPRPETSPRAWSRPMSTAATCSSSIRPARRRTSSGRTISTSACGPSRKGGPAASTSTRIARARSSRSAPA
jgi:hypothetical protein